MIQIISVYIIIVDKYMLPGIIYSQEKNYIFPDERTYMCLCIVAIANNFCIMLKKNAVASKYKRIKLLPNTGKRLSCLQCLNTQIITYSNSILGVWEFTETNQSRT